MSKKHVLIIDDDEDHHLIFARYIGAAYQVTHVSHPDPAVISTTIESLDPVCVLLDYHLGMTKGIDVLNNIRLESDVPVVMLTGEASSDVIVACIKGGADDYLLKDQIDRTRLLVTINTYAEKKRLQQTIEYLEQFLPVCASCKKVRVKGADPFVQSSWVPIETYLDTHSKSVTHGICPDCRTDLYGGFLKK